MRAKPIRDPEVFWTCASQSEAGCWEWQRNKTTAGYGLLNGGGGKYFYAHRYAWELMRGPIPAGLVIDHLCRNRACINPDHLDPVPQSINALRGAMSYNGAQTHCKHGHDITDPVNVYTDPYGGHRCRACASVENARRTAERQARRKAAGR